MGDAGFTETDTIEISRAVQKELLPLAIKIYRAHWKKTWEVDDCAMMSATKLKAHVDLQPILHAIVTQAVPVPLHTRVCTEAMDAKLAASCDETKQRDNEKLLEKYRADVRKRERLLAELADGHKH